MPQPIPEAPPFPTHDFAVGGSTAFASLLSLLLAEAGRSVLRLRNRAAGQRLPDGIDLALPISARPETWSVFASGRADTVALLDRQGLRSHLLSPDVRIETTTPGWTNGVSHLVHLARAAGISGNVLAHPNGHGFAFRRILRLDSDGLDRALAVHLERLKVQTLDLDSIEHVEGARVWVRGRVAPFESKKLILVDEPSISRFASSELWSQFLLAETGSTNLLACAAPLPAEIVLSPEAQVTLLQPRRGQVLSFTGGEIDADGRLASRLPTPYPIRRLASRRNRQLRSRDGAPVLQLDPASSHNLVAGLGHAGAFFAPVVARLLLGTSSSVEADWLEAHSGPSRRQDLTALLAEMT